MKQHGWFSTPEPVEDENKKIPTPRRSSRVTPRAVHRPTRITPPPPTPVSPTQFTPRSVNPSVQRPTYKTNEVKLYTIHDDETQNENSELTLPPSTTALVVKKPVK